MNASLDLRAERRSLIWLVVTCLAQLVLMVLTLTVFADHMSEKAGAIGGALFSVIAAMYLGSFGSLLNAYRSGLATATLTMLIISAVFDVLLQLFFIANLWSDMLATVVNVVYPSLDAMVIAFAAVLIALAARRVEVIVLAAVTALSAFVPVFTGVLELVSRKDDETVFWVLRYAPFLLLGATAVARLVSMPRADDRPSDESGWTSGLDGVRAVRTALIGQLVLTIFTVMLGMTASKSPGLAVAVLAIGGIGSLVFAGINVSGLGQLRRMSPTSDATGPMGAAWLVSLLGLVTAIGMALAVVFLLTKSKYRDDIPDFITRTTNYTVFYGFVASAALYNGLRRLGVALGDSALSSMALVTLIVGSVLQLAIGLFGYEDFSKAFFDGDGGIALAIGTLMCAIVVLVFALLTLGAAERALRERVNRKTDTAASVL